MADAFRRVFEAGRRRMLESEAETTQMFTETRDQLRILLRQRPRSGVIARSLLEDRERTEHVFGSLRVLLEEVYGSPERGFRLAVESLIENGHFADVEGLVACPLVEEDEFCRRAGLFARGMARYYTGDGPAALEALAEWSDGGAEGAPEWRDQARRVLGALIDEGLGDAVTARARDLASGLS